MFFLIYDFYTKILEAQLEKQQKCVGFYYKQFNLVIYMETR